MTSRELTFGFDFWSRGHLRVAVIHLHIKHGADIFIQSGVIDIVVARSKAINYLHLVAATVERHDRNSGRRPVESSLFSFILRTRLVYDVSVGLEC